MRFVVPLTVAFIVMMAGCADPGETSQLNEVPEEDVPHPPIFISEIVDLTLGSTGRTWGFIVHPAPYDVEISFVLKPKAGAPAGGGMPACLSFEAAGKTGSAGNCVGGGTGNLVIAPMVVAGEKVLYKAGTEAEPGNYVFKLEAQPSLSVLQVAVKIVYQVEQIPEPQKPPR